MAARVQTTRQYISFISSSNAADWTSSNSGNSQNLFAKAESQMAEAQGNAQAFTNGSPRFSPRAAALSRHIIRAAADRELVPSQYGALIRMGGGRTQQVETLLEHARRMDLPLSSRMLGPILKACVDHGNAEQALSIVRDLAARGQPLDAELFEPLFGSAVLRADEQGFALMSDSLALMSAADVAPSERIYGSLIMARLQRGELGDALATCKHALARGTPPSIDSLGALVSSLVEDRSEDAAVELCSTLRLSHGLKLPRGSEGVQALIRGAARSCMPLFALCVLEELNAPPSPSDQQLFRSLFALRMPLSTSDTLRIVRAGDLARKVYVEEPVQTASMHRAAYLADPFQLDALKGPQTTQAPKTVFASAWPRVADTEPAPEVHEELMMACLRSKNLAAARALVRGARELSLNLSQRTKEALLLAELDDAFVKDQSERSVELIGCAVRDCLWRLPHRGLADVVLRDGAARPTLDLRQLPDSVARACVLAFFKQLARQLDDGQLLSYPANSHFELSGLPGIDILLDSSSGRSAGGGGSGGGSDDGSGSLLRGDSMQADGPAHIGQAHMLQTLCASMEPALCVPLPTAGEPACVRVPAEEVRRWARTVTWQWAMERRKARFGLFALGHNVLYAGTLMTFLS
uniref:Pentacotripeptide-repeat region of PRORP domain-containing protein n=1 Tax=Chrysotila carterae TaxID=13221 RepID=A0A7S4C130_CHRCT